MIKILIVEDDENIAKSIEATTSIVGYSSEIISDGNIAVSKIKENDHDLVLLDIMLPQLSGFEIIEKIKHRKIPVIFLTALSDVSDKVKGLRLGAEDYITKPFEAMELLARIEVVLRRKSKTDDILVYDNIILDIKRHKASLNGQDIALTLKEFEIISLFIKNIDIVITRERLISGVWGYDYEGESRTLDIHIQQVRKKLSLSGKLITIPKLGYRLESRR